MIVYLCLVLVPFALATVVDTSVAILASRLAERRGWLP